MFFYNLHKKKTIFIHRRARSLQMLFTVHTVYGDNKKVLPLAGIMRKRGKSVPPYGFRACGGFADGRPPIFKSDV